MQMEQYKRIPITLITGFLGCGKSTFINKILSEKDTEFGLILNEFGDVNLESQIVKTHKDDVVELSNGCMCCVARNDIFESVIKLVEQKKDIEHIIIEASGLSDPQPIAGVLMALPFSKKLGVKLHLDTTICLIDPTSFFERKEEYVILVQQLEFASFVVLSKTDIASDEQIEKAKTEIMRINEKAKIFTTNDIELLLDTSPIDHTSAQQIEEYNNLEEEHHHEDHDHHDHSHEHHHHEHDHHNHHHEEVEILFFQSEKPLNYEAFRKVIISLPESVIRIKGFCYFSGEYEEAKVIIQCAGARHDGMIHKWDPDEKKQTAVVFIGKDFDKKELEKNLRLCEE